MQPRILMTSVQAIIDMFGGLEQFEHVKITNEAWMPLCIERIGEGPRNWPIFSVAHYGELNGDLMADPEMTFEVDPLGQWHPVSFRNDYAGIAQEGEFAAVLTLHGQTMARPRLVKELTAFARTWNKNIREQGFIAAAQKQAAAAGAEPAPAQ